jgi:hypothetical protein
MKELYKEVRTSVVTSTQGLKIKIIYEFNRDKG